jgi:hypothetical protein
MYFKILMLAFALSIAFGAAAVDAPLGAKRSEGRQSNLRPPAIRHDGCSYLQRPLGSGRLLFVLNCRGAHRTEEVIP